ncbi:uncharacterized protein TNCV_2657941 [Trichonephila clavipes]|nr:uncharacterized protein TNCV_2657941 [Trichonephila clavipes]
MYGNYILPLKLSVYHDLIKTEPRTKRWPHRGRGRGPGPMPKDFPACHLSEVQIYEGYSQFPPGLRSAIVAAVAEWYRHRIVAGFVTSSSPVPLKTRRVGQRCTLNLSRAETSSRWCGVVVRRGGCQLRCRPRHLTMVQNYVVRRQKPSCS